MRKLAVGATGRALAPFVLILVVAMLAPAGVLARGTPGGGGGGGGGRETTAVNNLSYPAIAVDGFAITPLAAPTFTVPYAGLYPGLTAEQIAALQATCYTPDPLVPENCYWYPQKTDGNKWQAEYQIGGPVDVTYIDWSDNMESVSPKVRSPFRIEMVLFKALDMPMTGYTMGVLEYPSSSNELQGTNTTTYPSLYATVISARPKLGIQYLGTTVPALTWDATASTWKLEDGSTPTPIPISFAPELNVGGKYVFGASEGGWKPTSAGYYRITFYVPGGSGVNLALGTIANAATGFTAPTEGVATAVLDTTNNLTYLDVLATGSGGGGRRP